MMGLLSSCGDGQKPDLPQTRKQSKKSGPKEQKQKPKVPMLTPAQSIEATEIAGPYHLETIVSEPAIEEPVLVAWDGNGRMYVCEMRSFMQNVKGEGQLEPTSRIIRFEDKDDDGHYEIRSVFADGLVLPRALLPLDDRILIRETNSLDIIALRDRDGDGEADERVVVYRSQQEDKRNLEHQDANLLWNIDNWIYSCQGGLRHRLLGDGSWQTEPVLSEMNQWGLTQDDTGQLFFANNSTPARDFQQPWVYWNLLNNELIAAYEREMLGPNVEPEFLETWPLIASDDAQGSSQELRSDGTLKTFTCACGQHIYRGDALPQLKGDFFICEPVGRFIRHAKIIEISGKKVLTNPHKKSEFLRSRDYFFRPVHLSTGPDGYLTLVDMNRGIIQESAWVMEGSTIKAVIDEKGLAHAKRRGRIMRLVGSTAAPHRPNPQMLKESSAELVSHLAHRNGWWRDTAQKLLVLRQDKTVVPALRTLLRQHTFALARLHGLWTLNGLGAIKKNDLLLAMQDEDWRVRGAAVRVSEPFLADGDQEVFDSLQTLLHDKSEKVLQQVVLSLAMGEKKIAWPIANMFISEHFSVSLVRMAAITAFQKAPLPIFKAMFQEGFFRERLKGSALEKSAPRLRNEWIFSLGYQFAAQRVVSKYRALDADGEKKLHRGQMKFQQNCVQCHGSDGRGATHQGKLIGANLSKSDRILGNPKGAVRILLRGLKGQVDGREIGVMIPYASQDDAFIADIISSLRWTQRRSMISADFVAEQRRLTQDRKSAWTLAELGHWAPSQIKPNPNWKVTASHGVDLVRMFDNNLLSRFFSEMPQEPGMSIEIDWGEALEVSYLVLDSGDSKDGYARGFNVEVKAQDGKWQEVGTYEKGQDQVEELELIPIAAAKLRITLTSSDPHPWGIHELKVYGHRPKK